MREPILEHTVELARMTHVEVARACEEASGVVVLPLGATEQHGPHLPLRTDTLYGETVCLRAARVAQVPVAPALPYGNSRQNIGFKGTVSIRPRVLIEVIKDICHSLFRHGFDKLVVVNSHGGNVGCVSLALEEFHYETNATAVSVRCWDLAEEDPWESPDVEGDVEGHAGRVETSLMLALAKEDVDTSAYSVGQPTVDLAGFGGIGPAQYPPFDAPITFMVTAWESSLGGQYGDPSAGSEAHGQAIVSAWTDRLAELLSALKRGELKMTTRAEPVPPH